MLTIWRMVQSRHAPRAFDGEGARLFGGRWNSPGVPAVYASESRALAMLEVLAGLGRLLHLESWVLIGAQLDKELVTAVDPVDLPDGWRAYPPSARVQAIGDAWIASAASVALAVPSALVPAESNFLLNPRHPGFSRVKVGVAERIDMDPRLTQWTGHDEVR